MGVVKKVGNILKKSSGFYKFGLRVYSFFYSGFVIAINGYLNLIEFMLPRNYFIQNVPDYVKTNFTEFKNDKKQYDRKQQHHRDGNRIVNGKYLLDAVFNLPQGDYAELGTYKGAFAQFIFKYKNPASTLYCFDTFEGFAKKDVQIEMDNLNLTVHEGFFSDTSLDMVKDTILNKKLTSEKLKLVKGYFPDSFLGFENLKWRFVLLDADLYEPIKEGVKHFWPNIVPGGLLMIHDYHGGYLGTKKAIDEYFTPLGIKPIPLGDKGGTAVVFKDCKR